MRWWRMRSRDADLERELQSDLELEEEEQRENGLSPDQARAAALRAFGNPGLIREQTRTVWAWNWLESLCRDVRFSLRSLSRSPGFTLAAVFVMALGIGANASLFTVVRGVLLKSLPFVAPDQLVLMYQAEPDRPHPMPWLPVDAASFWEWQRATQSIAQMAMVSPFQGYLVSSEGGKLPEQIDAAWCTDNFLSLLGVQPALGRGFTPEDDRPGAPATVILSAGFWKRRYSGDPTIVGRTIRLDAKPYLIVGVLPADFIYSGLFGGRNVQVWTPVRHEAPAALMQTYGDHEFQVVARMAPGITLSALESQLAAVQKQIKAVHPDSAVHPGVAGRSMLDDAVHDYRTPLYALLAATGCVLLIACMNVAGLLVARAIARNKEFAIRVALGGGRLRLLRERLIESLLLSAGGGALGLVMAWGVLAWLIHMRHDMNRVEMIHIDGVVAAFTAGIIMLSAIFSGLVAALSVGTKNVLAGLQAGSRSHSGGTKQATLRRVLLTIQVGLTLTLLVGAGLLLKSFERLRSSNIGVPADNVLTMRLSLPTARYKEPQQAVAFFEQMIARVRTLPGVSSAGLVSAAPGEGWSGDTQFSILEHPSLGPGQGLDFMLRGADPGYFSAIGLPILRGRNFETSERFERANVVLISRGAAEQYFPNEDPIGRHIKEVAGSGVWEVIGVVGDVRWNIALPSLPTLYWPIYGNGYTTATVVIRAAHDVESQSVPVQKIVERIDADLPVWGVMTLREAIGKSTVDSEFNSTLVLGFALVALLLAATGLYGVLAYVVAQRTTEFGIRIALGARRAHVLVKVLADGLQPAFVGLVLGLAASAASVRFISSILYETRPLDLTVFAGVVGLLLIVAVMACFFPAWRAARLDPVQALRDE